MGGELFAFVSILATYLPYAAHAYDHSAWSFCKNVEHSSAEPPLFDSSLALRTGDAWWQIWSGRWGREGRMGAPSQIWPTEWIKWNTQIPSRELMKQMVEIHIENSRDSLLSKVKLSGISIGMVFETQMKKYFRFSHDTMLSRYEDQGCARH